MQIRRQKPTVTTEIEDRPDLTDDDLMSVSDAAKYHGVSIPAVTDWIEQGELAYAIKDEGRLRRWLIREEVESFTKPSDRDT